MVVLVRRSSRIAAQHEPDRRATRSADAGERDRDQGRSVKSRQYSSRWRSQFRREATKQPPVDAGRLQRAKKERLYLVGRRDMRQDYESSEQSLYYIIMGSSGNVYYQTLKHREPPTCTCRDQRTRKSLCKHLLFLLVRVLKMPPDQDLSDVESIVEHGRKHLPNQVLAPSEVRSAFSEKTGIRLEGNHAVAEDTINVGPRHIEPGDDCPICYEDLSSHDLSDLTWCQNCRKSVHIDCFDRWSKARAKHHEPITCVYCRIAWRKARSRSGDVRPFKRARVNLKKNFVQSA